MRTERSYKDYLKAEYGDKIPHETPITQRDMVKIRSIPQEVKFNGRRNKPEDVV